MIPNMMKCFYQPSLEADTMKYPLVFPLPPSKGGNSCLTLFQASIKADFQYESPPEPLASVKIRADPGWSGKTRHKAPCCYPVVLITCVFQKPSDVDVTNIQVPRLGSEYLSDYATYSRSGQGTKMLASKLFIF